MSDRLSIVTAEVTALFDAAINALPLATAKDVEARRPLYQRKHEALNALAYLGGHLSSHRPQLRDAITNADANIAASIAIPTATGVVSAAPLAAIPQSPHMATGITTIDQSPIAILTQSRRESRLAALSSFDTVCGLVVTVTAVLLAFGPSSAALLAAARLSLSVCILAQFATSCIALITSVKMRKAQAEKLSSEGIPTSSTTHPGGQAR